MSDIIPNVIEPRLPDAFFASVLSASAEIVALIGDRYAPAREGIEPADLIGDDENESEAWPYVLYGLDPNHKERYDHYAQTPTLLESPFLIRAFMREDIAKARGVDLEEATAAVQKALQHAFGALSPLEILDDNGNLLGLVHGCEIIAPHASPTANAVLASPKWGFPFSSSVIEALACN